MKRLIIAGLLGSFAFAATAQVQPETEADLATQNQVQPAEAIQTDLEARTDTETALERDARRDCIRYTGSHLRPRNQREADATAGGDVDEQAVADLDRGDCVIASGSVYSREDLRRTGEINIADALRRLDPAIR